MDSWEAIRSLDEEENWVERNRVVSKADHLENVKCAKGIVEGLVDNLPTPTSPPAQQSSEFDYMKDFTDDDFQSSAAQFDVDYLESISSEANADPSDLARKSLFVKFDPLVGTKSPRGKVTPVNKQRLIPQSQGDLLLLGTPPNSGQKIKIGTQNIGTQNSETPSQSPFFSPLGPSTTGTHPQTQTTQPVMFVPETADLVNVLKYSEDDLPGILAAVRKEQRNAEAEKYESQIKALREKIATKRQQLQQNSKKKESFHSRSVLLISTNEKAEQDLVTYREKLKSHMKRHSDLHAKHGEFKKDVSELDEQLELISRDSMSLENAFDELHQQYVKEKAVHQCLSDRNKVIQQYTAELKRLVQEDVQSREQIQAQLQELEQRAEGTTEVVRREHTSRMTVERAKALKLKMELENLEKDFKRKEEEKQQVSQICDELMREMEATQLIG